MFKMKQLALCTMLIVFVTVPNPAQQSKSKLDSKLGIILEKGKRCVSYSKDFLDFARSHIDDSEYEGIFDLSTVAGSANECLNAAYSLLQVYDLLSCEADRSRVRPLIKMQISHWVDLIALSIEQINLRLASTKIPAVATSGTRFKEDLREVKSLLESIELR